METKNIEQMEKVDDSTVRIPKPIPVQEYDTIKITDILAQIEEKKASQQKVWDTYQADIDNLELTLAKMGEVGVRPANAELQGEAIITE